MRHCVRVPLVHLRDGGHQGLGSLCECVEIPKDHLAEQRFNDQSSGLVSRATRHSYQSRGLVLGAEIAKDHLAAH